MIKCPACDMILNCNDIHIDDGFALCPFCEEEFETDGGNNKNILSDFISWLFYGGW